MPQRSLIIGGASGIGFAVARQLAIRGDTVILAGRNEEKLKAAQKRLQSEGVRAVTTQLDISDENELAIFAENLGEVNHIVITAGSQAPGGAITTLDITSSRKAFDTKFWGSIAVARYLSQNLLPEGTLTFTTGFVARRTIAGTFVKATMNAALETAVKILAKELSPLRVNAVSPGLTDTEAYSSMPEEFRLQMLNNAAANLPAKRWGRAEDIAKGYMFVIENPFVTGAIIDIEGGALIS